MADLDLDALFGPRPEPAPTPKRGKRTKAEPAEVLESWWIVPPPDAGWVSVCSVVRSVFGSAYVPLAIVRRALEAVFHVPMIVVDESSRRLRVAEGALEGLRGSRVCPENEALEIREGHVSELEDALVLANEAEGAGLVLTSTMWERIFEKKGR